MTNKQKLAFVILAIRASGQDPKAQLTGYVQTGNPQYITRREGARQLVTELPTGMLKEYTGRV